MEALKVVVKRSEWNGKVVDKWVERSKLLDIHGQRCCLGFACKAAGVPDEKIFGKQAVHLLNEIPDSLKGLVEFVGLGTKVAFRLMGVNDNSAESSMQVLPKFDVLSEKEAYLIAEGRKAGLDFEFVD
jgi:hypothetical protein